MKHERLRIIIPLAILFLAGVAFATKTGLGTLSSFGWQDIAVLCPLGALGTMLASKTVVPRAVISLVLAFLAILVFGRAFCGWICPVPVWSKVRNLFTRQDARKRPAKKANEADADKPAADVQEKPSAEDAAGVNTAPLTKRELAQLKRGCHGCATAPENSRHIVLGGALLSAAIFGFPVFCLICPIGLSFAGVFTLIMLFGAGDLNWSVALIPVLLAVEVIFFRKWCSHICPLSALMSLVGKLNRTFRPEIDAEKCLETAHNSHCSRCAQVCEQGIDLHKPLTSTSLAECTRCMKCVDVCPTKALSLTAVPKTRVKEMHAGEAGANANALARDHASAGADARGRAEQEEAAHAAHAARAEDD